MTINKIILLALLGVSALKCADAGPKARVEEFLAKPTYQADFEKLSDEEKKQLAKDLNEVDDQLRGVKKNILRALCAPYFNKVDKAPLDPSYGKMRDAYLQAAAGNQVNKAEIAAPQKLKKMEEETQAPILAPKAPLAIPGNLAEKIAFF